jgi:replicative DNA helicase
MMIEAKKRLKITFIQVSQLNRNIEDTSRLTNRDLQYPQRSDLMGSDTLYQASDYVIVLHRPELLSIREYGPYKLPTKDMIYMHILKHREGEPKILTFENNLKYNRIEEFDANLFNIKKEN